MSLLIVRFAVASVIGAGLMGCSSNAAPTWTTTFGNGAFACSRFMNDPDEHRAVDQSLSTDGWAAVLKTSNPSVFSRVYKKQDAQVSFSWRAVDVVEKPLSEPMTECKVFSMAKSESDARTLVDDAGKVFGLTRNQSYRYTSAPDAKFPIVISYSSGAKPGTWFALVETVNDPQLTKILSGQLK